VSPFRQKPRASHRLAFLGLFVLFWLSLINLPTESLLPKLDSSWQGALSYCASKGLQFGKDVVFTFGPLGYLTTDTYSGYAVASRIGCDLVLKGVFGLLLTALALRLRPILRSWFIMNAVFFSQVSADAIYLFVIPLSACHVVESQLSPVLSVGVGALFAFVSLTKFTFCLLCATSLLIIAIHALSNRYWLRLAPLMASYLACLVLFWCLGGQRLPGVVAFLRGAGAVSSGYTAAMYINELGPAFWSGLGSALVAGGLWTGLAWASDEKRRDLTVLWLFSAALFLAWKEGFVRADQHMYTLCAFVLLAEPAAWAVFRPPVKCRRLLMSVTLVGLISPYGLLLLMRPQFVADLFPRARERIIENVRALVHPSDFLAAQEHALSQSKRKNSLPELKRLIGQDSVDVFGHEQAIALLNDLNYRPRPVIQGYSAYTPFLMALNRGFYQGPTAPAFVLFKFQTIDDRLVAADDAGALEVILRNYAPISLENEYWLWKRKPAGPTPTSHRLIREGTAAWGEPLALPGTQGPVWFEADIDSTWLGKLREFLYKPTAVTLTIELRNHDSARYRLVAPLAKSGFLINPFLRDLTDLSEMRRNPGQMNALSVTLNVQDPARLLYRPRYSYRLYATDELPPSP